jgi:hypothetical protein
MTRNAGEALVDLEIAVEAALADEFERLQQLAYDACVNLGVFWTRLYGANEALLAAYECLEGLPPTFYAHVGTHDTAAVCPNCGERNIPKTVRRFDVRDENTRASACLPTNRTEE